MNPYSLYQAFINYQFYILFAAVCTLDLITQQPDPDPYAQNAFMQGFQGNPHVRTGDFYRGETVRFKEYRRGPHNLRARDDFVLGQFIRACLIQRELQLREAEAQQRVAQRGDENINIPRAEERARREASMYWSSIAEDADFQELDIPSDMPFTAVTQTRQRAPNIVGDPPREYPLDLPESGIRLRRATRFRVHGLQGNDSSVHSRTRRDVRTQRSSQPPDRITAAEAHMLADSTRDAVYRLVLNRRRDEMQILARYHVPTGEPQPIQTTNNVRVETQNQLRAVGIPTSTFPGVRTSNQSSSSRSSAQSAVSIEPRQHTNQEGFLPILQEVVEQPVTLQLHINEDQTVAVLLHTSRSGKHLADLGLAAIPTQRLLIPICNQLPNLNSNNFNKPISIITAILILISTLYVIIKNKLREKKI